MTNQPSTNPAVMALEIAKLQARIADVEAQLDEKELIIWGFATSWIDEMSIPFDINKEGRTTFPDESIRKIRLVKEAEKGLHPKRLMLNWIEKNG